MDDIRQLRLAKWERIKQGGFWRFVLLRGVLGWGLSMGVIGIVFELVRFKIEKEEALPWYLILGFFWVGGFVWGIGTWFLSIWRYSRIP
jgi:hypothetical protein